MRLSELIEVLEELVDRNEEHDPEVRVAHQPGYPFQLDVTRVHLHVPEDEDGSEPVIYIAAPDQCGNEPYLPGEVAEDLGWT